MAKEPIMVRREKDTKDLIILFPESDANLGNMVALYTLIANNIYSYVHNEVGTLYAKNETKPAKDVKSLDDLPDILRNILAQDAAREEGHEGYVIVQRDSQKYRDRRYSR